MTTEEISNAILQRLYEIVFKEGREGFVDIRKFSESNNIDPELAFKVIDEFKERGFIETECSGGTYEFNSAALIYYEEQKLPDQKLFDYQNKVRKTLLLTLANMQENSPSGEGVYWQEWIQKAGVNDQDFTNNHKIMQSKNLIREESSSEYFITPYGKSTAQDYRKRKRRLEDFERLERLEGVTEQQRGHKLEDLLADTAEWEGWDVKRRVKAQGQENDIIMHVGLHYFLSSCKWEAGPIQPKEVELLESRVRSRAQTNGGILFSMASFTPNCIEEIRLKIATALIIPFGPGDIRRIMQNEATLTDLLDDKIDQVMNHRQFLVDGKLK
jgi:Mn-dependent DtxR family transcriptional regulator